MTIKLPQLLIYIAASALIVLLAVAGYMASIPSPAQYWGFVPELSPIQAAESSFAEHDYRFLGARVINNQLEEGEFVFEIFQCSDHPSGHRDPRSFANYAELDGMDAWDKAENIRRYARAYNLTLLDLFEKNTDTRCSTYDLR
jgi:hypothetical protein